MIFGRKDQKPIRIADKQVKEWKYTTCGYCSTGCSIEIGMNEQGNAVASRGVADADVNRGKLCIKGIFEHELFDAAGRGNNPLVRDQIHEQYKEISWDVALDTMGEKIKAIQDKYGKDAFAIVSTFELGNEIPKIAS